MLRRMRKFVVLVIVTIFALVGCSNENSGPDIFSLQSLSIPEAFRGEWTGSMDHVQITQNDIVIEYGEKVLRLSEVVSRESNSVYESYNGNLYYAVVGIDSARHPGVERIEMYIQPYNNGLNLRVKVIQINGDSYFFAYSYLVPAEELQCSDSLRVPTGYDGNYEFNVGDEIHSSKIEDGNIILWVYGVPAAVDVQSKLDSCNGRIIHQHYDRTNEIYDLILEYEEDGTMYRLAWTINFYNEDNFRVFYSTRLNDLQSAQGYLPYYRTDEAGQI